MERDARLETIRTNLFYGLSRYTKSFPDFSIPQKFQMVSPREGSRLLQDIEASLGEEEEILLYIHLPFCHLECVFCNASPRKTNGEIQSQYLDTLLREIDIYAASNVFAGKKIRCIYFGGGTPTTYSNAALDSILNRVRASADLSDDCNITCEAHPQGLVKNDRLEELAGLGIHRISVGSQSFDPKVLELCNRKSSESQVAEVIERARKLQVSTNVDMMIGLPGQTLEDVRKDLDVLSQMAPDSVEYMRHEIVNPLAVALYESNPKLMVTDDELFWMAFHTQEWMEENGYEQNGRFESERCFPFRYHWLQERPFIGLGCRSRSYTKTVCYDTHEDLGLYSQIVRKGIAPVARYMPLDRKEQMYRSLFLQLQLKRGVDLEQFTQRFGASPAKALPSLLSHLSDCECIAVDDSSIRLTRYGRYFVEDVCCCIIDHALEEGGYPSHFKRLPHSSGARSRQALAT